jgi:hypothetical protein
LALSRLHSSAAKGGHGWWRFEGAYDEIEASCFGSAQPESGWNMIETRATNVASCAGPS